MIELNAQEREMLREILTDYLSDLRMEIADTDSMDFREALKRRRQFVEGLVDRLAQEQPAPR